MTDDKGAGDGPYTKGSEVFYTTENSITLISEPDIAVANAAHSAGRKAERERCLRILRSHPEKCEGIVLGDCLETVIELIGGGQDAK